MEIFKIVAFVIIALVLLVILKDTNKEISVLVIIAASVILFGFVILKLDTVVSLLYDLVDNAGINKDYLSVLVKVTGIAYIVELTKNICIDAGSSSLATKVEMAGKVSIVVLTIPILTNVISVIIQIV